MDRAVLEDHLRQARAHAALGREHIARQHQIIAEFNGGARGAMAKTLLKKFEALQELHLADVKRLERELKNAKARVRADPRPTLISGHSQR